MRKTLLLALYALRITHYASIGPLERGQRPQPVFDGRQAGADDRIDHFLGGLVAGVGFVERDVALVVDDDALGAVLAVDHFLRELLLGRRPRHTPPGAVVDREAAVDRARRRAQDEAVVAVAAGDQDRVPGILPQRVVERRVPGGEGAGGALAVDPDLAVVGVPLALHQVV